MKTIYKDTLPACNLCNQPATYDAPTSNGRWAYMCTTCFAGNASRNADSVGFQFSTEPEPVVTDAELAREISDAVWSGDFELAEELLGDRDPAEFL